MKRAILGVLALGAAGLMACGGRLVLGQNVAEHVVRTDEPRVVEIQTPDGSIGSGVVFDHKGDIVTNAHVVGKAATFQVTQKAGTKPLPARLVGVSRAHDLAVIRVTTDAGDLRPVTWADSAKTKVGEWALAMGTPFGLAGTVTQGIVSATNRTVREADSSVVITGAIQTSAAINPGNSGGGLVDLNGHVIGMPTLALVDPQLGAVPGIGFAIPSNTVVTVARQLIGHHS